jgi:hypothetical protein
MKKSILVFVVGCVSAAILPTYLSAQDSTNQNSLASTRSLSKSSPAAVSLPGMTAFDAAEAGAVSTKAIKDFSNRYAGVSTEKWCTTREGFIAYFQQNGIVSRAFYNKKGRWTASLRYASERQLPRDVRAQVKSVYYDYVITAIELVEIPEHMVYLIHLEDAVSIKIVRISDEGNMDVYQEFSKN